MEDRDVGTESVQRVSQLRCGESVLELLNVDFGIRKVVNLDGKADTFKSVHLEGPRDAPKVINEALGAPNGPNVAPRAAKMGGQMR